MRIVTLSKQNFIVNECLFVDWIMMLLNIHLRKLLFKNSCILYFSVRARSTNYNERYHYFNSGFSVFETNSKVTAAYCKDID